ncbi:MAG: LysM peptidoglycan-binding domain-containing protein [Chloroflexi bacterium]|nr:LysM peptidoglycan-binding domain-containing protein [Chloroflexota bacterium]
MTVPDRPARYPWLAVPVILLFFGIGYASPDLFSVSPPPPPTPLPRGAGGGLRAAEPSRPSIGGPPPTNTVARAVTPTPRVSTPQPTPPADRLVAALPAPSPTPRATPPVAAPPTSPSPLTPFPVGEGPGVRATTPTGVLTTVRTQTSTYRVREGDSLSTIAERFGTTVQAIVDANRLGQADSLDVGQELRIPGRGRLTYVVRAGDTLGDIAERFGLTVADLKRANGLVDEDTLEIGQEIGIPAR